MHCAFTSHNQLHMYGFFFTYKTGSVAHLVQHFTWMRREHGILALDCSGLGYTDSDYTLRTFFQLEDNLFLWGLELVDYIFLYNI